MVTTRSSGAPRARGRFGVRRGTKAPAGRPAGYPGGHPVGHRTRLEAGAAPRSALPRQRPTESATDPVGSGRGQRIAALGMRLGGMRSVHLFGCLVAAGWAAAFPIVSDLANQRLWGSVAAPAYLLAGLAVVTLPRPWAGRVAAVIALLGAVLLPLGVLAAQGHHQSEVMVVERSAQLLLHTGTPYLPHPAKVTDFNPYLPAMALFGLPRALLGTDGLLCRVFGDARIWFALSFLGCLTISWRLLRPTRQYSALLPLGVLTGSPLIALTLAVGGVDLPLIGVCCLAMALAARGRAIAAGLVLALACTLKWTAWPALPVAVLLLWRLYGRRPAGRAALTAVLVGAAVILPFALTRTQNFLNQVIRFPLGLAAVRTPAGSPLPGKVLADLGPVGHTISIVLMVLGGVAVAGWLLLRPPTSAVAAADLLAGGLTIAFMLAPAGRFGYLALPAVLAIWPRLAARSWTGRLSGTARTVETEGVAVVH
ncbi:glycosyltransferase 87 family protein [Kitasatospora sp. NBC_01250]|uniref:glycosyltransferase 87 family protein n=1 Tax=unclassified Kitasatospora TaxID=2633591 RepID=UPI002E112252|nr:MULTISPECIES: glycosyltransferase 87 family protein [unclassified Kitasatospora]WSJ68833.1 glycosyltransferase 87 family protein [Kitasatospora sp. NBC_01302]